MVKHRGAKFGHIVTEETRLKIRNKLKGREVPREIKIKIANAIREGYRKGTRRPYWLNKKQSVDSNTKKSNTLRGKSYEELFGAEKSRELKRIRSESKKGQFVMGRSTWNKGVAMSTPTKQKLKHIGIEMWKNEDYRTVQVSRILKGLLKRPTSYEKRVSDLCIEFNLPFVYCGNGTFILGGKNPDFKHNDLSLLIEVYNKFHHPDDYEEIRKKHFEKYGYKVIFITEEEVLDKDYKNVCLKKISEGLKG